MEETIFPSPAVAWELEQNFIEARLHNDGEVNIERITALQEEFVGVVGAPHYVLVDPNTGGKLRLQGGFTTEGRFRDFLRGAE